MTRDLGDTLVAFRPGHAHKVLGGMWNRIVCPACESSFHQADDYAINFRRDLIAGTTRQEPLSGSSLKLRVHQGNAVLLHHFALQTLLRAHLSPRQENRQVFLTAPEPEFLIEAVCDHSAATLPLWPTAIRYIAGDRGASLMSAMTRSHEKISVHFISVPHLTFQIGGPSTGLPPAFAATALSDPFSIPIWHARNWVEEEIRIFASAYAEHHETAERLVTRPGPNVRR